MARGNDAFVAFLDCGNSHADNYQVMATSTRKPSNRRPTAQKRAADKAEEVAKVLHSFAATLNSLDALNPPTRKALPNPRNWWRLQAGRFKDDPTFPDFVAQVQATRKREG
jgi:hypothetical protein